RTIIVSDSTHFLRTKVLLVDCKISEETSTLEPMKGAVRLSAKDFPECWIYPNSVGGAMLEWEGPLRVMEGEVLTVFKKRGKNAKVFMTGRVRFLKEAKHHEGEENVEVHYGRDF